MITKTSSNGKPLQKESKMNTYNVFMQAPVAIAILKGKDYIVELANDTYLQVVGKEKDFIGKPLFESFPELESQIIRQLLDQVMQSGTPYYGNELEVHMLRDKKRAQGFYNFVYQPLREQGDTITGIIVIGNEVTEQVLARKKVEESEYRYHNMIYTSPSLIAILKGEDMMIETANDAIIESWGKGKDVIGKSLFDIIPEAIEQGFDQLLLSVYKTGKPLHAYEMPITLVRNGKAELVFYSFVYQAHRNIKNEIDGIAVIANEVTSQAILNQKVKESEARFRNLVEQTITPICIFIGKDMILEVANEAVFNIWNVGKEALGKPFLEIVPEMKDQPFMDLLLDVYNNGVTRHGYEEPAHFTRKNGTKETLYFNFIYQPYREDSGNILGVIVFATDVTEQVIAKKTNLETREMRAKELEAEVQKRTLEINEANHVLQLRNQELQEAKKKIFSEYSRSLIEASLDPLIVISLDGKITDMNEALARVTGKTRQQLTNTDFKLYFTDPQKAQEGYQEVFAKGFVTNYPLTIKDHVLTDVLFNGSVYKDEQGKVLGAVVVARDITEQKRFEKRLTQARVFAESAASIAEEATRKAEDAVRSKQQFLSNMSHEIRTPMNAIIGFTKVMLKTDLSAKQKEYLTAIKVSGDALIVLINDILDLAKVDAGKMTFEQTPFRMALSISAMLHLFETKIQEKNLKLIKEYDNNIPEVLVGDPVRLHQIILNLISNAVKFTAKGNITVSVRLLKEDEESVRIKFAITDTGIGIAENQINTIFENFQQASTGISRLYGGTGLGLAISKQLVEMQGGNIWVKSKIDEGSKFTFTLTFQKTDAAAAMETEIFELDTEMKNIKVLVVEDMPLNQLLMKTVLDDFGFERDIAENGKIAIEKLQAKSYDIILMDLQMPEMNGFEATEYIRNTLHSKIPIIALTADVTTTDLAKCKAIGMNDYIAKPVDERLLYNKIIGLVKKPESIQLNKVKALSQIEKLKCTDMSYLLRLTKSNPVLMMEMIGAYLEQTPPLILLMKESFQNKDWNLLYATVHKIIPSFVIIGISPNFESMAKQVQEYARTQQLEDEIPDFVLQLENICVQACEELKTELNVMKNTQP